MLSREDNELLTRTGPGTRMGEVFRRYWLPALLSAELAEPDGAPVRVRLLGEDLIAFRDTTGAVGLVGAYCPHRRAPLFFGRNEKCGLRCIYHGWKFDRSGTCVDMPTEPPGSRLKAEVKLDAYPTWEGGGIVWAYLGPAGAQPPPPDLELVRAPATHRHVSRMTQDCNYLQGLEGGLDSAHAMIMHNNNIGDLSWISDYERIPKLTVQRTDYGFSYSGVRTLGNRKWVRVYQYIMPVTQIRGRIAPLGGGSAPRSVPTICGHLWVPADDVTTTVYNFMYSADPNIPVTPEFAHEMEVDDGRGPEDLLPDGRLKRNLANDYMIDRQLQKTRTMTGIAGVNTQDAAVQEGMGPIVDRTKEHLSATDMAVVTMRRLLLDAVKTVEAGGAPRGTDPSGYRSRRAVDHIVEEGDVKEIMEREAIARF
jgi:phenylpropionate dioxygenase-like ring-hydroxylating dioxygenase large terminal subunit